MKKYLLAAIVLFSVISCGKKTGYESEIKEFQYKLNLEFANKKTSPLTEEGLKTFSGLDFFKIDKKYRVIAKLELTPNSKIFQMKTTTTELQLYKKYAIAHFELDGKQLSLNLYESLELENNPEYKNFLFLPFNDNSNGTLTYGGGRFIDLQIPADNSSIIIDFNEAYNPYCAYSHRYSCPIPPAENSLPISILAGVKAYHGK